MRKTILVCSILFLFCKTTLSGQNLVINPSFEIGNDSIAIIPPGEFSIARAKGWSLPTRAQASLYSSIPILATTDRALSRWKFTAKEGNNVVGIMTYGTLAGNENHQLREYMQGSLSKPLSIGKKYYVSYWVHFHCEGTNNIGFSFQKRPINTDSVFRLPLKPHIVNEEIASYSATKVWIQVRDSFVATEAYTHFVMGNFLSNRETKIESNKYRYHKAYIDDVVVEAAADGTMQPKTFDNWINSEPNMIAVIPAITPSVSGDKNETKTTTPPAPTIRKGETLILDKVFFNINSTVLREESAAELDKLVLVLQKNETIHILVKGHSSSDGGDDYNMKLSENRAQSVVTYLKQKGIAIERLSFKGYGKTQPIFPNDSEENRQRNRRVEFEILNQ
jgi:outer membrane protein OmpA-like peptidoglycan-associated protein